MFTKVILVSIFFVQCCLTLNVLRVTVIKHVKLKLVVNIHTFLIDNDR